MSSKSIPLLVAKLDHFTCCFVSGLITHRNPEREPGSGSATLSYKAVGRKWGRKVILPQGACQKHYCQATLNLFRNAFYLWLKDPRVFLKAEKCSLTDRLTQKLRSLRQGWSQGWIFKQGIQEMPWGWYQQDRLPISPSRNPVYVEHTFHFKN